MVLKILVVIFNDDNNVDDEDDDDDDNDNGGAYAIDVLPALMTSFPFSLLHVKLTMQIMRKHKIALASQIS